MEESVCGWLTKRGGRVKTWKKRWFVLRGLQLAYFKEQADLQPLGVITLAKKAANGLGFDSSYTCEVEFMPSEEEPKKQHCFRITSNQHAHRNFYCYAKTSKDMDRWMEGLCRVVYASRGGGMFGTNIELQLMNEKKEQSDIPFIVDASMQFITDYGLDEVGIFRLPGSLVRLRNIKEKFQQARDPDLQRGDIQEVASLLKLYLRQLPEPLLTRALYQSFLSAADLLKTDTVAVRSLAISTTTTIGSSSSSNSADCLSHQKLCESR
eukprot:m.328169 g.328169  ORF g.328169 m.328169 type:complete len:266 (-) comp16031_c1_seq4:1103-1900(-)